METRKRKRELTSVIEINSLYCFKLISTNGTALSVSRLAATAGSELGTKATRDDFLGKNIIDSSSESDSSFVSRAGDGTGSDLVLTRRDNSCA